MAADMFLKISGVRGESVDAKHREWIEVTGLIHKVTNPATGQYGGGMGQGKATLGDITVSKVHDFSSPSIWQDCATGRHIDQVDIECRKQGGVGMPYLVIKLQECVITSYALGTSSGAQSSDTISFAYSKIWHNAIQQGANGAKIADNPKGYDLKANKKL